MPTATIEGEARDLTETAGSSTTDIATIVSKNPILVLTDAKKADEFLAHVKSEVEAFAPDLSTKKGRDAVASFAFKITRSKTAIDDAGGKMVAGINAARNALKKKLDEYRDLARKPLTDWETVENERLEWCNDLLSRLRSAALLPLGTTIEEAEKKLATVQGFDLPKDKLQELYDTAEAAQKEAVETLERGITQLKEQAAQREELERLKRQELERLAAAPKEPEQKTAPEAKSEIEASASASRARANNEQGQPLACDKPTESAVPTAAATDRRAIIADAIDAVVSSCQVDRALASRLVLAIAARQIPRITIQF